MSRKSTHGEVPATHRGDIWLTRPAFQKPAAENSLRQRGSIRRSQACDIFIRVGASFIIAKKILDLSLEGVFVEMDTTDITEGDRAELIISFAYNGRQVEHPLFAKVVRIRPEGIALKFDPYSNRTYTDLVNLLYTK